METLRQPVKSPLAEIANRLTDMSENIAHRDPLYLFACHLEWHTRRNLVAYEELLAALDDNDADIRSVAEALLHRSSPRPERTETSAEVW
jgi:hypothetical protein